MARRWATAALVASVLAAGVGAGPALGAAPSRYSIANGCYALVSKPTGQQVGKSPTGGYRLTGVGGEGFRMQATALGEYLFYGRARDFMSARPVSVPLVGGQGRLESAGSPSQDSNWRVSPAGAGAFKIVSLSTGKALSASGPAGELVLVDPASAGLFTFDSTGGC